MHFAAESFDAVVCISSLEHVGLGHYASDPIDVNGDMRCLDFIRKWLKPGGFVYFDVPWNPDPGYRVLGTETRVYDDRALETRLSGDTWHEKARIYVNRHHIPGSDEHELGVKATSAHERFHYVVCIWQKPVPIEYLG